MFRTIPVLDEDKERIKRLKEKLGKKEYEVITMLLDVYEKIDTICMYLGCSFDEFYYKISENLPKMKGRRIISKLNEIQKYLENLNDEGLLTPQEVNVAWNVLLKAIERVENKYFRKVAGYAKE